MGSAVDRQELRERRGSRLRCLWTVHALLLQGRTLALVAGTVYFPGMNTPQALDPDTYAGPMGRPFSADLAGALVLPCG